MPEVAAGPAAKIENGKRRVARDRFQERPVVLADVVIQGAGTEIFGRPVIMADGHFRCAPQLRVVERATRLHEITLRHLPAARRHTLSLGRRTVTVVPLPGWLVIASVPSWSSTSERGVARPRPTPPR